jgi:hypothetical protein
VGIHLRLVRRPAPADVASHWPTSPVRAGPRRTPPDQHPAARRRRRSALFRPRALTGAAAEFVRGGPLRGPPAARGVIVWISAQGRAQHAFGVRPRRYYRLSAARPPGRILLPLCFTAACCRSRCW